jgi:ketosteroid isomerase-like protein
MLKSALALALGIACSSTFAADVRTDCASSGKDSVGQLHRDWLMIGWERDAGDPDFNFRKDLGKYYDFNSQDLNLFDDFDPELKVRHTSDDYGKVWYGLVPKFKSVHHKITEQPGVVAAGQGYSHSVMEFVFEVTPKQGDPMYFISRTSLLWRCTADGWKIFKEHNSARPTNAAAYQNAK